MGNKIKIYEQGLEEYPKLNAIIGNFFMLVWIVLGVVACWFLYPLAAWIYLIFAIIIVFVVLRKLVCTNCYYYDKWCNIGWGKLCAVFFKKGDIEKFSISPGIKIAPFVYGSLTLIPLILLIISLFKGFSTLKLSVLILILIIGFYSGTISRKKSCADCKMRIICPGSAVRYNDERNSGKIDSE
ncbi:MAG TPA: hypothetical protein ENI52_02940 [Thermoplasmata archaeon]|nr:hypothetical protein [Thermoplasmata archaeon]